MKVFVNSVHVADAKETSDGSIAFPMTVSFCKAHSGNIDPADIKKELFELLIDKEFEIETKEEYWQNLLKQAEGIQTDKDAVAVGKQILTALIQSKF